MRRGMIIKRPPPNPAPGRESRAEPKPAAFRRRLGTSASGGRASGAGPHRFRGPWRLQDRRRMGRRRISWSVTGHRDRSQTGPGQARTAGAQIPAVSDVDFCCSFRDVCGRFATGVCVVTSFGPDGPVGADRQRGHVAVARAAADDRLLRPRVADAAGGRAFAAVRGPVPRPRPGGARRPLRLQAARRRRSSTASRWTRARRACRCWTACLGGLVCELRELVPGGDHLIAIGEVVDLWQARASRWSSTSGDYWRLSGREPAPAEVDEALEP